MTETRVLYVRPVPVPRAKPKGPRSDLSAYFNQILLLKRQSEKKGQKTFDKTHQ